MGATDTSAQTHRAPVRVGLIGTSEPTRQALRDGLERYGLAVVVEGDLHGFLSAGGPEAVQVVLVDLHAMDDDGLDALPDLLALEGLPPVLFNEDAPAEHENVWMRRLAGKLAAIAAPDSANAEPAEPEQPKAPDYWVLGASFGGPEAVKRFLESIPEVPDAAFVLIQHIGDGFVDLLSAQLNRSTPFQVLPLVSGTILRPGHVYVMPVDRKLRLTEDHRVMLEPDPVGDRSYSPCIDAAMAEMARGFGPRAAAIVFSGMGDDGAEGARAIAGAGGEVWAQDAGSCAISSMPDSAAETGVVSRRGSPEELARAMVQYLRATAQP